MNPDQWDWLDRRWKDILDEISICVFLKIYASVQLQCRRSDDLCDIGNASLLRSF